MPQPGNDEFVELQTLLRADTSGAECKRLETMLLDFAHSIKQRVDRGVPPAEYDALRRVMDAATAGNEVLLAVWRGYHPA